MLHRAPFTLLLAAAAAATPLAVVPGFANVANDCDFPVTLWSVGSEISQAHTLPAGADGAVQYSERFDQDPKTGGRTLKMTASPDGLFTGQPQTDFAYNLQGASIWYDMSDVFGNPFAGRVVVVRSDDPACPEIVWPAGVPTGDNETKVCGAGSNITLTLCSR